MKMSEQIIEVLNYLCQKIGFTIDWTADNVLPYVETLCEKLVKWEISTSWMWIGIAGALLLLGLIASIIIHKVSYDGCVWIFYFVIAIVAFMIIGVQIYDIITCHTFPEKFIYDYIKTLVDTGGCR
jgi:hypothetical protein